jgi:hypothetical protein
MDLPAPLQSCDVLSPEEEGALVMLRETVDDLRARGIVVDRAAVGGALRGAGALRADESDGAEPACFTFRGARFSLRSGPPGADGIEVNFIRSQP